MTSFLLLQPYETATCLFVQPFQQRRNITEFHPMLSAILFNHGFWGSGEARLFGVDRHERELPVIIRGVPIYTVRFRYSFANSARIWRFLYISGVQIQFVKSPEYDRRTKFIIFLSVLVLKIRKCSRTWLFCFSVLKGKQFAEWE